MKDRARGAEEIWDMADKIVDLLVEEWGKGAPSDDVLNLFVCLTAQMMLSIGKPRVLFPQFVQALKMNLARGEAN